jgi:UDP-N-acetylmuramate dehydrogenase
MRPWQKAAAFIELNLPETSFRFDEDMKKHTSFQTGGSADLLIEPGSVAELQELVKYLRAENLPYLILGQGSNTLVSDRGLRQAVIKIGQR